KIKQETEALTSSYASNKTEINSLVSEYEKLNAKAQSGGLSAEEEERYKDVVQQLSELMPSVVESIDSKGNAHLRSADAIKEEINYLEKLNSLEASNFVESFSDELDEINDKISQTKLRIREIENEPIGTGRSTLSIEKKDNLTAEEQIA